MSISASCSIRRGSSSGRASVTIPCTSQCSTIILHKSKRKLVLFIRWHRNKKQTKLSAALSWHNQIGRADKLLHPFNSQWKFQSLTQFSVARPLAFPTQIANCLVQKIKIYNTVSNSSCRYVAEFGDTSARLLLTLRKFDLKSSCNLFFQFILNSKEFIFP